MTHEAEKSTERSVEVPLMIQGAAQIFSQAVQLFLFDTRDFREEKLDPDAAEKTQYALVADEHLFTQRFVFNGFRSHVQNAQAQLSRAQTLNGPFVQSFHVLCIGYDMDCPIARFYEVQTLMGHGFGLLFVKDLGGCFFTDFDYFSL